jgi:PAS domain S-box-containing protein
MNACAREPEVDAAARLAAIVQGSDDAIISETLDGLITSWNPGAERVFGYTADEAIGRPITLIVPPERRDEQTAVLGRIRRGEAVAHFETERLAKDGRRIPVSLTMSPVRDARDRIVGASKILRDVSERRRLEAERTRQLGELHFLGEVSRVLASSLDYEATLANVAELAVSEVADWAAVHLVDEAGSVVRVAVAHRDPVKTEFARRWFERHPLQPGARTRS